MTKTGRFRQLESIGRLSIPSDIREQMDMGAGSPVEFFIDKKAGLLAIRPYRVGCIFCHSIENLTRYHGQDVCQDCRKEAAQ